MISSKTCNVGASLIYLQHVNHYRVQCTRQKRETILCIQRSEIYSKVECLAAPEFHIRLEVVEGLDSRVHVWHSTFNVQCRLSNVVGSNAMFESVHNMCKVEQLNDIPAY